jgi:ABC-type Na+ transport system ATPase subunit NatA
MHVLKAFVLVVGSIAVAPTAVAAQTTATPSPSRPTRGFYKRTTLDERVKRFAKVLDLNESQQTRLKSVLERQQMQANQIRLDQSLSGAARISRLRNLQQDTVLQIRSLLNDEQKKKYDPLDHEKQTNSSDSYVNDWMKTPQR